MFYLVKTPWLLKLIYSQCVWKLPAKEKVIYLTFDDGPHPEITPFVLSTLKKYEAKATFFCIGKNVAAYPDCYRNILEQGHRTGNHTNNHLNGWKVKDEEYINDIMAASKYIDSDLFRPPYGRITRFQIKALREKKNNPFNIIMWDVLSGDFDKAIDGEKCAMHVIAHARKGSVVVFHDSEKAFPRLEYALPKVLQFFSKKGYRFESLRV
jgi:peptidoglycan-N-acetylglucosamine deacetylase